jgi:hypothetical protein
VEDLIMSITIYYKGNLKEPENIAGLMNAIREYSQPLGWEIVGLKGVEGIYVDIPDTVNIAFAPRDGWIDDFAKSTDDSEETLDEIFGLFRSIKPFFKRLHIEDDYGLWNDYIARYSKEKFPQFRELKSCEKEELNRYFDLPEGSDSIFGMSNAEAVVMFMLMKDMSDDLAVVMTEEKLLSLTISLTPQIQPLPEIFMKSLKSSVFITVCENWLVTKMEDKNGAPLINRRELWHNSEIFAHVMAVIIFKGGVGMAEYKYSKLLRFMDRLTRQGHELSERENFLRFAYVCMEYLGIYRPERLIDRRA